MELITTFIGTVVGFVVALAAHFIAHDAYSSAPRYACSLIERAVRALPVGDRARYQEEWLADLNERPSALSKFRHAVECYICAKKIAAICSQPRAVRTAWVTGNAKLHEDGITLDTPSAVFVLLTLKSCALKENLEEEDFFAIHAEIKRRLGPVNLDSVLRLSELMIAHAKDASRPRPVDYSAERTSESLNKIDEMLARLGWSSADPK